MKVELEDLIENLDGFSDEHLYALIGGSVEAASASPQSGHTLAKRGRKFLEHFLAKFRDAICEKDGLRDQVRKIGGVQAQKAMIPIVTAWIIARGGSGMEIGQVVAIYLAILITRSGLDACCDEQKRTK